MEQQRALRLSVAQRPGDSTWILRERNREVNNPTQKAPREKILSDTLKRQARRIMQDVTECPADTITAHVARLDGVKEIISEFLSHYLDESPEARPSGKQLCNPVTLHDYLAALKITRDTHRAPAFINAHDAALARIEHKIDTLAGLFAHSPALNAVLDESQVDL